MKIWVSLSVCCLLVLAGLVFLVPDLRGWTPSDLTDPAASVAPTGRGGPAFSVNECLPGSVSPHELPDTEDGAGSATMTVITCRSKSSAFTFGMIWLLLSGSYLVVQTRRVKASKAK